MSTVDPGLQRERTSLAWSRTSLVLVANGALLLVRRPDVLPRTTSIVLGGLFVLLAAVTIYVSRVRARWLLDPGFSAATRRLVPLGTAVLVLCVLTTMAVAAEAFR